jgi:dihydroorotate dehydrogenase electron transfer subunit
MNGGRQKPLRALIRERREPAPEHVELIVEAGDLARTRPGQFAHVFTGGTLRRPLSFSRLEGDRAGLLFRVVGEGTRWLANRRPGEALDLMAPLGRGFPAPEPGPLCLVGGGVGIPPVFFAAQVWSASHPTTAILGGRTADHVVMVGDFRTLPVTVQVTTEDGSAGDAGRVTGPLARWLGDHPDGTVMACGPVPMLRAVARLVGDSRPAYLAFESRMGCGVGACLACVVPGQGPDGPRWQRVCRDGPVFRADELWWGDGGPEQPA